MALTEEQIQLAATIDRHVKDALGRSGGVRDHRGVGRGRDVFQ